MADLIDQGNETADIFLEAALSRSKLHPEVEATGACLNCDHILHNGRRWCDVECMEDWQKREQQERMQEW